MVCPGHSFQSLSVGRWSSAEEPRASLSPGGAAQAVELTNWLPRGWIHWGDTLWGRLSLPAKGCWPFNRSDQRPRDFFLLWNHARKNLHAIFFSFSFPSMHLYLLQCLNKAQLVPKCLCTAWLFTAIPSGEFGHTLSHPAQHGEEEWRLVRRPGEAAH